ncbi:hypothetical protein CF160_07910 [Enterococcus pseudoavium]|nr:hypothetical protein CF160_07910 [Enterococcus pseudoavium]
MDKFRYLISKCKESSNIHWRVLAYVSVILGIIISINNVLNVSIWLDDAYTLGIIKYPASEIIYLTGLDVHPPLYYLIVRFFFLLSPANPFMQVIYGRFISLLPILITIFVGFLIFREYNMDKYKSIFFSSLFMFMPHISYYSVEIRMYSWAMLFIGVSFFGALKYLKNYSYKWLFLVLLGSTLAAYTHYFSAVMGGLIFLFLFIYGLGKKSKKVVVEAFIAAILFLILYSPWLIVAIGQVKGVANSYWIPPLTIKTIAKIYLWPFVESVMGTFISKKDLLIGIIMTVVMLTFGSPYFFKKVPRYETPIISLGIWIFLATVSFSVLISILMSPVFDVRYSFPALFPLYISLVLLLDRVFCFTKFKQAFFIIITSFIVINTTFCVISAKKNFTQNVEMRELINSNWLEKAPVVSLDTEEMSHSATFSFYKGTAVFDSAMEEIVSEGKEGGTAPQIFLQKTIPDIFPVSKININSLKSVIVIKPIWSSNDRLEKLLEKGFVIKEEKTINVRQTGMARMYLLRKGTNK